MKNYLFTVAHNLYITKYLKDKLKIKKINEMKFEALSDNISEDERTLEQKSKKLLELLEKLPPRCKQIILLNKKPPPN